MSRNRIIFALFLLFAFTLLILPMAAQNSSPPASSNPQTPSSQNGNSNSTASPTPEQTPPAAVERSETSTTPGYVQPATTTDTPDRQPTPKSFSWAGGIIGLAIGFVVGYELGSRRPVTDVRQNRAA